MRFRTLLGSLAVIFSWGQTSSPHLQSLVAAEYAFAQKASREGTRSAFLSVLHPDATVFRPQPVNGMEWVSHEKDDGSKLSWYPFRADVSGSGDLGYTTGPWEFRVKADGPAIVHGWYVSIWIREGISPWKLFLDMGTPNAAPISQPTPLPQGMFITAEKPIPSSHAAPSLLEVDRAFAKSLALNALLAYESSGLDGLRMYRSKQFPLEGQAAIRAYLEPCPKVSQSESEASWISADEQLGFTRGRVIRTAGEKHESAIYVRIWKRVGSDWKLVLDAENPIPDPTPH